MYRNHKPLISLMCLWFMKNCVKFFSSAAEKEGTLMNFSWFVEIQFFLTKSIDFHFDRP